jgi:1-pyrroline-5-carboxylate dehydrogenase
MSRQFWTSTASDSHDARPVNKERFVTPSLPSNEPVLTYAPGSPEREALRTRLRELQSTRIELPMFIGGHEIRTGWFEEAVEPHDHRHVLALAHLADAAQMERAVEAARRAALDWSRLAAAGRAAIFLKAAELAAGPWRATLNAATMLGQSKTVHQAEIDSAAELVDFFRFNVAFMLRMHAEQPLSSPGIHNSLDYRPLEGFVYAATPFNFTAIAANLPCAPALMGNTVVWKPSTHAKFSAHFVMQLLREAGLPDGVINLVYGDPAALSEVALASPFLGGVHFTGSTAVFQNILQQVHGAPGRYRSYPRIVGETGGKNFVVAHASCDPEALVAAVVRGAFEYQGQKCSAASRLFVPASIWPRVKERLVAEMAEIRVGDVTDFSNFMGAVIDERAWNRHAAAIGRARAGQGGHLVAGGEHCREQGFFVHPTLIETDDLSSPFLTEELFGPIAGVHVYADRAYEDLLAAIDGTSAYGLTGAIFAQDRAAIAHATDRLRDAAGNFYINDKPTGAVVGQQPFGGARLSGTNDKAGSLWNLIRWVSPRTIKESFVPARDWRYPSLVSDPASQSAATGHASRAPAGPPARS